MAGAGGDPESSDDDIEIVPKSVDNYWLEDGDETPVSFASLPYFKTGEEYSSNKLVYVRGIQDNGMRLYMRAMAWKLEFSKDIKPVFHLKTEKYWIELKKPRKSFETTIRSILSTATFLNYALMNPGNPERVAWKHVKLAYKSWDVAPSCSDLASFQSVIRHLIETNDRLASSFALRTIDPGFSGKRSALARENAQQSRELHQHKNEEGLLDNKEELDTCGDNSNMAGAGDFVETVCCNCDDGGDMICCDGPCMRSFHLKDASGSCSILGLSKLDADRMDKFLCPNCEFKRHQCYICGELGSSDDVSGDGREVFVCGVGSCGHFYHPSCVVKLVLRDKDISAQAAMVKSIKEGKGFVCPMHNCWKCRKVEVTDDRNLQFGVCRRCPRVWHRQCLPSSFLHDIPRRCWYGLLPNKILVYCNQHTIIPELATPARNHVKFPNVSMPTAHKRLVKGKAEEEGKKSKPCKLDCLKKKAVKSLKSSDGDAAAKLSGKKREPLSVFKQTKPEGHEPTKPKLNQSGVARVPCSAVKLIKERTTVGGCGKQELSSEANKQKCDSLSEHISTLDSKLARRSTLVAKAAALRKSPLHQLEARVYKCSKERKGMVEDIIERAKVSIPGENVLKKHEVPVSSAQVTKKQDKTDSSVELELILKGMGKAVETLENGGSIEDAKSYCSPDYISYIESCRKDLKLYLGPLLHDTSYGGHLTKPEKLKEIVDRLHGYLEEGDTIVDVTCGSNSFLLLLKKKLEQLKKTCEYKNFDLVQRENDLNFPKQNWFEATTSELPDGDRLIIRLNQPYQLKGHLVNQFIDYALAFKPKLIVLIVSEEVQRGDLKHDMYDLVWEDTNLLGGQSFKLPCPIDVHGNSLNGWDNAPHLLYFWSRRDLSLKHKQIAFDQGHISTLTSSHFAGSPLGASSPRFPSDADFDSKTDWNNEAAVRLGGRKEMGDLGKIKYISSQGESVNVNESTRGGEVMNDTDKKKSNTLQVEHTIMNEPMGGQGIVSNLDNLNDPKLDQIRGRRERDGPTLDAQVHDYDTMSYKLNTTINHTKDDGYVPQTQHVILKRKRADSSFEEPSGSQSSLYGSLEQVRNVSRHGVFRKERKPDVKDICEDERNVMELAPDSHQHKMMSEKNLANTEADLCGRRSPDRQDMYEPDKKKLADKHGISRQGGTPSPDMPLHSEWWIESPDKACPSSAVDVGNFLVKKNVKNENYVNPELSKTISRHVNAAECESVDRNFYGQEALSAQRAQSQHPLTGRNAQVPGHYNGAAFATLNRHTGLQHSPHPPGVMEDINPRRNQYGTEHHFGLSRPGRVHFLPEGQQSHQYFGPSTFTPLNPAPFYAPPQPVRLPPGYGSVQPEYWDPLGFQGDFIPNQPQFPACPQGLPDPRNTGGWFED